MPAPLIVVNPAAGGGAAGRDWASIASTVRSHFGPFDCRFTSAPGDAGLIAEAEGRAGRKLLIALGGDGTISDVACGILRSGAPCELGALPYGTGADFLRTIGMPRRLADAARVLKRAESRRIDVGRVTFEGSAGQESRFYVNSASFGMSGGVAERANRATKRWGGRVSFALATLKTALFFSAPQVRLEFDDSPPRLLRISQVAACNGRYFGGGMKIAPEARLGDGWLDVVVIEALPVTRLLAHSPRLYSGTHVGLKEVSQRRVRSLAASAPDATDPVLLEVDGETPGRLPARFEVCPQALLLRVP